MTENTPQIHQDDEITKAQLSKEKNAIYKAAREELQLNLINYIFQSNLTKEGLREGVTDLKDNLEQYFYDYMTFCNEENHQKDPRNYPIMKEDVKKELAHKLVNILINDYGQLIDEIGSDPWSVDPNADSNRAQTVYAELEKIGATKQDLYYAKYALESLNLEKNPSFDTMLEADLTAIELLLPEAPYTQIVDSSPSLDNAHISGRAGAIKAR